ncbi:MAG: hypothetical protein IJ723_02995, partial [Ruminococcus sp.]|nr:hypothetical protein [Ruminococcus sp.]
MSVFKLFRRGWARLPEQVSRLFRRRTEFAEQTFRHNLEAYGGRGVTLLQGQGTEPLRSMKYGKYSMK